MDKKSGILVIPRHAVTVRFVDVPSLDDNEIKQMVEFQAIKEIPYPKEDMVISCRNLGSFKDGFSSIMLVIARKEMISEKMREAENRGVSVENIRLFSELLYLFFMKQSIVRSDRVTLLMHIGRDDSEMMVIDKTRPLFSRGFENMSRFLDEIHRTVSSYKRDKNSSEIQDILVFHSSGVNIDDTKSRLKEHFSVPVNFYAYNYDLADIDLAAQIDLLPRELSERNTTLQKKYETVVTYSLIAVVLILFFSFCSFKLYEKRNYLEMLSSKLIKMQSETEPLEGFLKETEAAKRHKEKGDFIAGVLEKSYNLIPSNVSISGVSYDGDKYIFYKGSTKDMPDIFAFVKILEQSKYFGKVEVKYATKKKVKGEEVIDFSIQCLING